MTVAAEIAEALKLMDTTHVFGVIGEGNMVLANALTDSAGLSFIGSRHESAAVGMADGHARASGTVGVATVTQGPGVTNTATALITALNARTPLLLLAPEVPASVPWHIQELELDAFAAGVGVACVNLDLAAPRQAVMACHDWVRQHAQPMIVRFPYPELEAVTTENAVLGDPSMREWHADTPAVPSQEQLRQAAELLAESAKPVILIGHGARLSGAEDAIAALAEATGAIIATTLMAKGILASHPHSVGLCGGFSRPQAHRLIKESDLVLVFGATLNQFTTHHGRILPDGAPIVHCDAVRGHIGRITEVDVPLVGDAAETAKELTRRFLAEREARPFRRDTGGVSEPSRTSNVTPREGFLNPEQLMGALDAVLPADRIVVVEGGHNMGFCSRNLRAQGSRNFFVPIEFGAIGTAMGFGIGASFAQPQLCPVITIGDGSLLMSLGELETLCRYDVPCVVIVLDDGSYAAEYHALDRKGLNREHSLYPHRDFAAVARSLGAQAHTLRHLDDVAALPPITVERLTGPLILDCKIDVTIRGEWLDT